MKVKELLRFFEKNQGKEISEKELNKFLNKLLKKNPSKKKLKKNILNQKSSYQS
jgi:hypothetical protein